MFQAVLGLGSRHGKIEHVCYARQAMLYTGRTKVVQVWGSGLRGGKSNSGK